MLVLLTIVSLWSCKEENSQIAEGLFEGDKAEFVPGLSFDVRGIVEADADAVTNNVVTGFAGTYNDPIVGKISSAFAFEFQIEKEEKFNNIDDVIVDSVCIHVGLDLNNSLYDTITNQKINLYRLKSSLKNVKRSVDLVGTTSSPLDFKGDLWATKEISNKSFDITNTKRDEETGELVKSDTVKHPYVKFKLNNSAVKTFQDEFISNSGIYSSQNAFNDFFKGIYIESDGQVKTGNGGLYGFNIRSSNTTRLVIYYRLKSESEDENGNIPNRKYTSYTVFFKASASSNRLNIFKHESKDNILDSSNPLYILGGAGLRANLSLPKLEEILSWHGKRDMFINKAEISLKLDPNTVLTDTIIPSQLILVAFNNDGDIVSIPGFYPAPNEKPFLDGYYYKQTKEYKFNIAKLLQNIVNYNKDKFYENTNIDLSKGFAVYPANRRENPRRVILDGESIKLKVTYTKL